MRVITRAYHNNILIGLWESSRILSTKTVNELNTTIDEITSITIIVLED